MAESISTLRASGGDYTSVQTWLDTEVETYDCVANATSPVLEWYNDWAGGKSEDVSFSAGAGYDANSTHHPIIRAAAGERHDGTPGTGVKLINATINSHVITCTGADYLEIDGMEIGTYSSYGYRHCVHLNSNHTGVRIRNCILGHHSGSIDESRGIATTYATYSDLVIEGNLFLGHIGIESGYKARLATSGSVSRNVFNCSVRAIETHTGGTTSTTTQALQNNVFYQCGADVHADINFSSPSNNATSAASGLPGTSNVYDVVSGDFADAANDDFHLSSGSVLIGAGANLYTDGSDVDVDGDVWPNSVWDIGFDYYVAASGAASYSISGSVSVAATPAAILDYQKHPSILGDVTLTAVPAAITGFSSGYIIVGDVSVALTPAATLDHQKHPAIIGDSEVSAVPAATMEHQSHPAILGDVALTAVPAATLVHASGNYILGDVSIGATPASAMGFQRHASISGDIVLDITPGSALDHQIHRALIGDVSIGAVPVSVMAWTEYVPLSLSQADLDAISEAIWSRVIDTLDAEEVMKVLLSAMAGKVSGAETGTIRFRDIADTKDRIVAEVDGNGNRTSVTLDVT